MSTQARREYLRAYQSRWLKARREAWLAEHGPCAACGAWENLQVDHVDPDTKVSHRVWGWRLDRRLAELAKCHVLCGPCHTDKTLRENGLARNGHGTWVQYRRRGCRCDRCRAAHADEAAKYRANRGERRARERHRGAA